MTTTTSIKLLRVIPDELYENLKSRGLLFPNFEEVPETQQFATRPISPIVSEKKQCIDKSETGPYKIRFYLYSSILVQVFGL